MAIIIKIVQETESIIIVDFIANTKDYCHADL